MDLHVVCSIESLPCVESTIQKLGACVFDIVYEVELCLGTIGKGDQAIADDGK